MLFRTHIFFGIFCYLILDLYIKTPWFVLIGVLAGSVFVDIDSCNSKVGKKFWVLSYFFKHRGILHSLIMCFVLGCVVGTCNLWLGFGFGAGYLSHLILDGFTVAGIELFWPFKGKIKGFIRSGGWMEDIIFVLLLCVNILFGVHKFL